MRKRGNSLANASGYYGLGYVIWKIALGRIANWRIGCHEWVVHRCFIRHCWTSQQWHPILLHQLESAMVGVRSFVLVYKARIGRSSTEPHAVGRQRAESR